MELFPIISRQNRREVIFLKKIVCMLMILPLIPLAAFAEGNAPAGNALGFAVLDALYDESGNQIISPVSLTFALAMAARGAQGDTKQEILDALGVEDLDGVTGLSQPLTDAGLKLANAAFWLKGEAKQDYIDALEAGFDAQWFRPEGGVADTVNAWVDEHTDGMIDKLMDGEPDPNTMLMLLNAAAMDAKWAMPFSSYESNEDLFHAPDGDATIPFMRQTARLAYGERDNVKLLRLDYRDSTLQLWLALPEEGGLKDVLAGIRDEGMEYFALDEEPSQVILSMPKMDVSCDNILNEVLIAQGVETAFGPDADFSGIADENLFLSLVRQKARVIFDEEGTKAAAVTEIAMPTCAMLPPEDVKTFQMNRPFAFVVADSATGAVCFAGAVVNPAA